MIDLKQASEIAINKLNDTSFHINTELKEGKDYYLIGFDKNNNEELPIPGDYYPMFVVYKKDGTIKEYTLPSTIGFKLEKNARVIQAPLEFVYPRDKDEE